MTKSKKWSYQTKFLIHQTKFLVCKWRVKSISSNQSEPLKSNVEKRCKKSQKLSIANSMQNMTHKCPVKKCPLPMQQESSQNERATNSPIYEFTSHVTSSCAKQIPNMYTKLPLLLPPTQIYICIYPQTMLPYQKKETITYILYILSIQKYHLKKKMSICTQCTFCTYFRYKSVVFFKKRNKYLYITYILYIFWIQKSFPKNNTQ
eukprot:TRINITY_DN19624_c0_g1_i3.p1 TRINITY_DN19624_c0_g1~~TRINITY_DN19624_c0_g1_i3.p1  ORF type:complete len:205 (+),score=-12.00 TRINITY_DN19624_c0_g1_i3:52-666(+)